MATWAKGVSFKNSDNTKNIGGIGVYGNDTTAEKLYIGLGTEPWNNAGIQLTNSAINFKGNKIYHAGDKPSYSDVGAAPSSHNHTSLSGVNLIAFNAQSSDGVSIKTIVNESATYLDMFMYDDVNQDKFRWRFKPHSTDSALTVERSLMELYCKTASTTNTAHLDLYGSFKATDTITAPTFSGALAGNASTATKLQTARTINGTSFDGTGNITTANWGTARNITIGNTSKSVNGSDNVAWSLNEIGAAASNHTHSYLPLGGGTLTGETVFNHYLSLNAWSGYGSGKAQLWYNGSNKQLVIQPNAVTDIIVNNNKVYHAGRKPTAAEIGAAASSHTHNYIPLTGSTGITGPLRSNAEIQTTSQNAFRAVSGNYGFFIRNDGANTYFMLTNSGDQYGNWNSLRPLAINNSTGAVTLGNGAIGNLQGNASTATKLAASKTIALSGDATGSASFDGSANATINATVRKTCFVGSDAENTAGWYKVASQTMSGYGDTNITFAVTSTYANYNSGILQLQIRADNTSITCKRLVWHTRIGLSTSHYIVNISGMTWTLYAYQPNGRYGRLMFEVMSQSNINDKNAGFALHNSSTKESANPTATVTSSDAATVATANTLTTARNIKIGNVARSFNGGGDVTWTVGDIGAAPASHNHTSLTGVTKITGAGASSSWGSIDIGGSKASWAGIHFSDMGYVFLVNKDGYTGVWNNGGSAVFAFKDGALVNGTVGWDKITSKPSTYPAASHNHDVLISAGGRIASADIAAKGDRGLRMYLATSSMTTGKPSSDGFILNFDWDTTAGWSSQMYIKNSNSPILQLRGMNAGTWGSWYTVYSTNNKPKPSEIGAAEASHSHSNYLPLSGGTVTGAISSSLATNTHLAGNQGTAIINSTAAGNGYTMLAKMNSTNGVWTMGGWTDSFNLFYTANSVVSAGSNNTTKRLILLNEAGNSSFPGIVSGAFNGSLSGNATTATTLQNTRTINGTNFNGSANITTAKWGTARNITIGNAKKSIDGGSDATWTIEQIGAAPASHSHTNYVQTSDYSLTTISKTLTIGTSWMDTGITGANLKTGSYMIQISGMASDATSFYGEIWTGTMSWYSEATNSTDADEIILHKAGHASNGRTIYLRTLRVASTGTLKLQICASTALKATNVTFKFRKLI